jgi:hypothetical protein
MDSCYALRDNPNGKDFLKFYLALIYQHLNRNVVSSMAQAGRAIEFLQRDQACIWEKHQCYRGDANAPVPFQHIELFGDGTHPPH